MFVAILLVYRRYRRPEAIKGLVEITEDLPVETPVHYKRMISSEPIVNWYWREHDSTILTNLPSYTNIEFDERDDRFVNYSDGDGAKIEDAYRRWKNNGSSESFHLVLADTLGPAGAGSLTVHQDVRRGHDPEVSGAMIEVGKFIDRKSGKRTPTFP